MVVKGERKMRIRKLGVLLIVAIIAAALYIPAQAKTYAIGTSSYDVFRSQTIGKEFDVDNAYGVQCVDGAGVLWQQFGRSLSTGGTGGARGCWEVESARKANAGTEFSLVYSINDVKRGDVVVMYNPSENQYGHICFADEDYKGNGALSIYGQNQNGTKAFNVFNHKSFAKYFLGGFRLKKWENMYELVAAANTGGKLKTTPAKSYKAGTTVTLEATPNTGYAFVSWTSDQATFSNKYTAKTTFKMPSKKTWINAWFTVCKTHSTKAVVCTVKNAHDTKSTAPVSRHVPSADAGQVVKTYKPGDKVTAVGTVTNAVNNVWYKLQDGSYIWSGCVTPEYANTLKLPQGLTAIGEEAFAGATCDGIIVPRTCTSIGSKAFANCKNLIYIQIPKSVTSIANDAFSGCGTLVIERVD